MKGTRVCWGTMRGSMNIFFKDASVNHNTDANWTSWQKPGGEHYEYRL